MLQAALLVSLGAAAGALARWFLGLSLNALFPAIPPGTLVANLVGGFLIGVVIEALNAPIPMAPELRALLVTGFLGGLNTFSSFSAEVSLLLQQGRGLLAATEVLLHVCGSVALTLAGMACVAWLRRGA
jgi:CrcB protein